MTDYSPYVYVFVRSDLTPEQKVVQVGHACLEAGNRFDQPMQVCNMVVLSAVCEDHLKQIHLYLDTCGIDHEMFHEPDWDTGHTAIATRPVFGDERQFFADFELHRHQERV